MRIEDAGVCKICLDHYGSTTCLAFGEQGHGSAPAESTEPSDTAAALEPMSEEQTEPANNEEPGI